jgi:hypothetical protein
VGLGLGIFAGGWSGIQLPQFPFSYALETETALLAINSSILTALIVFIKTAPCAFVQVATASYYLLSFSSTVFVDLLHCIFTPTMLLCR